MGYKKLQYPIISIMYKTLEDLESLITLARTRNIEHESCELLFKNLQSLARQLRYEIEENDQTMAERHAIFSKFDDGNQLRLLPDVPTSDRAS